MGQAEDRETLTLTVGRAYSRDRRGEHPLAHLASWSGILQADAYGGYNELYALCRQPGPVLEAGCFAHARRKFFELADVEGAARKRSRDERTGMIYPIALEAVQWLDALFDIERTINGRSAAERLAVRQELSGGQRAAILYTLILTARLNDVDPQAWLADVLARIADHPVSRLNELLPWNWQPSAQAIAA